MSDELEIKPSFLIIGAQKSGTTSLCHLLGSHPDVYMTKPKEPHFFSFARNYGKGWKWYASLFSNMNGEAAVGEGSTSYTMEGLFPHAVHRLAHHLPDARLIYIVRHPLHRIESHWFHLRFTNRTAKSLDKAFEDYPDMIDNTLYWKQINRYRNYYDDSKILILFFEDFIENTDEVLKKCWQFLSVDQFQPLSSAYRPRNTSIGRVILTPFGRRVHRLGFADAIGRVPWPAALLTRRLIYKKISKRPKWKDATREYVIDQIANDIEHFLTFYGKPRDFWNLTLK